MRDLAFIYANGLGIDADEEKAGLDELSELMQSDELDNDTIKQLNQTIKRIFTKTKNPFFSI